RNVSRERSVCSTSGATPTESSWSTPSDPGRRPARSTASTRATPRCSDFEAPRRPTGFRSARPWRSRRDSGAFLASWSYTGSKPRTSRWGSVSLRPSPGAWKKRSPGSRPSSNRTRPRHSPPGIRPMHEEAMLHDVVRKATEVARREGATRVTRVRLWVGARSHLGGPELKDRWAHAVTGTALSGAEVEIETSSDRSDPNAENVILRSLDVDPGEGRS